MLYNRFASSKPEPSKSKMMKSYPFAASESDDELKSTNNIALPPMPNDKVIRKSSTKPAPPPPTRKPEELSKPPSPKQQSKGNVVLDKFGNFRLVEEPPALPKQEPPIMARKSRSRSKPRNYRSGSSRSSRSSRGRIGNTSYL